MSLYFSWQLSLLQEILLIALLLLFVGSLLYLYCIYNRVARYRKRVVDGGVSHVRELPGVSVVVYMSGDNAAHIEHTMELLVAQQYPHYEVIVVNDDAGAQAAGIVAGYESLHKNVYQTAVPDGVRNVSRRKLGITLGVKAARHEIIVVTEAHCAPVSELWLNKVARNFVTGIDVVLGYTRFAWAPATDTCYARFDRLTFALRYMAYAVAGRPYMGVCGNLAYRRELFFAHNGFSQTLNLQYGDDDLFVNQVATRRNTRIELSPDSVVELTCDHNARHWDALRRRYNFTSRYCHTSARMVFAIESVVHYLLWIAAIACIVTGIPGLLAAIVALPVMVAYWLLTWRVYRRAGKVLGERFGSGWTPVYLLMRPWHTLRYAFTRGKHNKSYTTWQYLR